MDTANVYKIIPRKSEYSIDVDGRGKLKNNFNPVQIKKTKQRELFKGVRSF